MRSPRLAQCDNFRVIALRILVKALAHDRAVLHDHAAHRRIRARQAHTSTRQFERVLHKVQIVIVHGIS